MPDAGFFQPTAAPANRPTQGIAAPLIAASQAQATAFAQVGAQIGKAIGEQRERTEFTSKVNDFTQALIGEEGFQKVPVKLAQFSPELSMAMARGAELGIDETTMPAFLTKELMRVRPDLSEETAGAYVHDMTREREIRIATPELKGKLASMQGELLALGMSESAVQGLFNTYGQDTVLDYESMVEGLGKDARDRLASAAFLSSQAGAFGTAAGRSAFDASPAGRAQQERTVTDSIEIQNQQAAAARANAKPNALASAQAEAAVQDSNAGRLLEAQEFAKLERKARLEFDLKRREDAAKTITVSKEAAAASERAAELIRKASSKLSTALTRGASKQEFERIQSIIERFPGTEAARAAQAQLDTKGTDGGSQVDVIVSPESLLNDLAREFPQVPREDLRDLVRSQQAELGVRDLSEFEAEQQQIVGDYASSLEQQGKAELLQRQRAESSNPFGNANVSAEDASDIIRRNTGTLSSLLRVDDAFVGQVSRELGIAGSVTGLTGRNAGLIYTTVEDGRMQFHAADGDPNRQAILDKLESHPGIQSAAKYAARQAITGGAAGNLSPSEAGNIVDILLRQSAGEQNVTVRTPAGQTESQDFFGTNPDDL